MKTVNTLLIVYLIIFIDARLYGQDAQYRFNHFGLAEGLSQSGVYSIAQDAEGFLWFGTQDGLNKYDGYSFTIYKNDPADTNSLSINYITNIISDHRGNLWIGTEHSGVDLFEPGTNKFHHFKHTDINSGSLSDDRINFIYEETDRELWVGTYSGLDRYDSVSGCFEHYYFVIDSLNNKPLPVTALCYKPSGGLVVGTSAGIFVIDKNSTHHSQPQKFSDVSLLKGYNVTALHLNSGGTIWCGTLSTPLLKINPLVNSFETISNCSNGVQTIYEDADNNLWLGSANSAGVTIYNPHDDAISYVSNIPGDIINKIYGDNSGLIWIGTFFHGVYCYDPSNNRFRHYLNDEQNPNIVMSLLEDDIGNIWAGTFGNGLKKYNSARNELKSYSTGKSKKYSLSGNKIISLCKTSGGEIFIGTFGDGLDRLNPSTGSILNYSRHVPPDKYGLSSNDITALFEDSHKQLWIGNLIGGVDILDYSNSTFKHYNRETIPEGPSGTVTAIREDDKGSIWIGTLNGLYKFIDKTAAFERIVLDSAVSRRIQTLYLDGDIIWIGTDGGGLVKYDPGAGQTITYTKADGLSDNIVYGILPDDAGNLWISTNYGISVLDLSKNTFRRYNRSDGLQSNEFNQGAYFKSITGELFFGGVNGFNSFFPSEIKLNNRIPPVCITDFKVFDKSLMLPQPIQFTKQIELLYNQNYFSFEFTALNFSAPEKNQYAYKLEGFDKDWHITGSDKRFASYTNLDPGVYTLKIRGSNDDGIWNEKGTSLILNILPPFWMTWWFRILVIIATVLTAVSLYKYRIGKLRMLDQMRLRIARDLHDEVGSDLGGITLMSRRIQKDKNVPQDIKSEIMEVTNAVNQTSEKLRDIVWFVNPEHDNSEHLILRLKDLAGNLLKDISYKFKVPDNINFRNFDLESRRQIYLIIKEILYNIVRHSRANKVSISIEERQSRLLINIEDNGIGFCPDEFSKTPGGESGMGLKNIRKRSESLNAELTINSGDSKGTSFIINIPVP